MRTVILLAVLLMVWTCSPAAPMKVEVPEQDWVISFDAPQLAGKQEMMQNGNYAFKAGGQRFSLSVFVEKPLGAGRTHKECADFYWRQASGNPMIAKDSITIAETPKYVRVGYDIVIEFPGLSMRQRHVNYFFVHDERWIDVHISVIDPLPGDAAVFAAFDRSLSYGPAADFGNVSAVNAPTAADGGQTRAP